jgi:hypothetical protein
MMASLQGLTNNLNLVSSVNGNIGAFPDIRFGREGYKTQPFDPRLLERAHTSFTQAQAVRGGWAHLTLHHTQDPRKGPAWAEAMQGSMSLEDWSQEYGISYQTSTRWRILTELDVARDTYSPEEWDEVWDEFGHTGRRLVGWDFGTGRSLTCYAAALYFESTDTLVFFDYRSWQEAHVDDVAREYGEAGWRTKEHRDGMEPDDLVGDVAGKQKASDKRSWLVNLKDKGIPIDGRMCTNLSKWSMVLRKKIREGKILFAPATSVRHNRKLPSLTESMAGWKWKVTEEGIARGGGEAGALKADKDMLESHLADAALYVCMEVWGERSGGVTVRPLE